MTLNDEQQKYVDYLNNTILPQLKELNNDQIQILVTNLEWNLKKSFGSG